MTNTIRLIIKPTQQIRSIVRGIGLPGPQGPPLDLATAAARNTHPDSPLVLWVALPDFDLRISSPHALSTGYMRDQQVIYDNQDMVD